MPKSAAEATPPTGNRFVEFDEFIDYQLNKASKSIQSTDVLVGVVGAALGLTIYLFVFILADHWLVTGGLGTWARAAYWGVGLAGLGYWVATRLFRPLNGRVNVLFAARQIERTQPALKSSLLTLTDLKQAGRATTGHIRGSLEKRAAVGLSKADVEEAVDRSTLMTCSYALLFLLAVFCGYALFSPKSIVQSAWRALVPFTSTGVATRTRIDHVNPGNVEVPALSHLDVEVEISGNAPEEATLFYTTADGAFVDEPLPLRDTGEGLRRYRGTLIGPDGRGLRQNLTYHVVAGDARSESYSVTVVQSPSAVVDSVEYEYQTYTGIEKKTEPGGAIDAWEGTRVTVRATANQKVKSAMVLFSDTEDTSVKAEEIPMLVEEGTKLRASWQLAFRTDRSLPADRLFPKFYRVQVVTEDEHRDPLPTLQPLNIRADLPPQVEVLHPKSDVQAPVNGSVAIAYRVSDPDFKLRTLILNLEHDGKVLVSSPRLFAGPPDEESREGVHRLNLKDLNLAAGSRLTYWLEARDNFEPFGERPGNRSFSPRLNIDLVDPKPPTETRQQEEQAAKEAHQALDEARPNQEQPAGAEDRKDPGQEGAPNASESRPSNDPGQAPNEAAQPENGKPEDGKQGQPGSSNPDGASEPMPGDRSQDPKPGQPPAGTPPQQSPGEKPGDNDPEKQPGNREGESQARDQQTGDKQQTTPNGQNRDGTQGSEPQEPGKQSQQSGPREKAQDDTAIQKLLEWDQKQKERQKSEGRDPASADNSSADQPPRKPGDNKSGDQPPQGEPGAKDPSSPMKGQEDRATGTPGDEQAKPKESGPENDPSKSAGETGKQGQPGAKPMDDPMQQPAASGDKPAADDQKGKSADKPEAADSPSAQPDKNAPPKAGDSSKTNKPGEPTGEPSKSNDSGQEASKPDPGQKPGDKPADNTSQTPMGDGPMEKRPMGDNAPGGKPQSQERQDGKQGPADANSKGQESPTGQSGDRAQPGEQKPPMQEKAGNSSQKPAGQSNDQGTREQGAGDPGSSTPDSSGGQKSPGPGEPGQQGEKSSSGQKTGSAKSDDGNKTSNPGSKGSEPQPDGKSAEDGKSGSKDGGKGQEQSSQPGEEKGPQEGAQQDGVGGQKPGDKGESGSKTSKGEEKSADGESGGKQGGEKAQPGDQKGSGQKQGGDQKSQDGGGQQGKSGDNASGGQSSSGEASDGKPGSQAGNKPGMGTGGSGQGAASEHGASNESSGGESGADPVNLENRKKATNLALKRLQETLERGQIDPELQKELGYTDEELRTFMDRLQERLADNGDDNSPEAQARRRQFEQLLKGINLETQTSNRAGKSGDGPAASGFGNSSRPAPSEYRAAEKRYRESLNRKK